MKKFLFSSLCFWSCLTFAATYKYSDLQTRDYDEMRTMVLDLLNKAESGSESAAQDDGESSVDDQQAMEYLRDAIKLILSRPDQDNVVSKLIPDVRKKLNEFNSYYDTMASLSAEAIKGVGKDKLSSAERATYLVILQNMMSELNPEINGKDEVRKIFEKIRDAKIEIPRPVASNLFMGSMRKIESPSETAKKALSKAEKTKAKSKK